MKNLPKSSSKLIKKRPYNLLHFRNYVYLFVCTFILYFFGPSAYNMFISEIQGIKRKFCSFNLSLFICGLWGQLSTSCIITLIKKNWSCQP